MRRQRASSWRVVQLHNEEIRIAHATKCRCVVEAHALQSTRKMSAFLTSRDFALRLALSLVIATEASLFGLLLSLNGGFDGAPHFSLAIGTATVALIGAALVS